MKAEQQVIDALLRWNPPEAPKRLTHWVTAQAQQTHALETPGRMAFEDHAGEMFGYLFALVDEAWLAEELLQRAFVRAKDDLPDRVALFLSARYAALELLAKSASTTDATPPADRALLLERRLGFGLEELARGWGTSAGVLEGRLIETARAAAPAGEACPSWQDPTLRAALDLLDDAGTEAWTAHLVACSACERWSAEVEAALGLAGARPVDPEATWERIDAALQRHDQDLGIRVAVRCTYCHDRFRQQDAAFCATCLAPHHADCFRTHSGCSAPGCVGDDLVFPTRESASEPATSESTTATPARRRWPLLGALLIGGYGVAALTTANWDEPTWTRSRVELEQGEQPGEAVETPTPSIPDLRPGMKRADVERLLGEPDAVRSNPLRLCYYRKGARVILDRRERLVQASFFGVPDSDQPRAIRGERPLPQLSKEGYYRPGRWSVRGIVLGQPIAATETLSQRIGDVHIERNGDRWVQLDARTLLEIDGTIPHVVRAVHLSPGFYEGAGKPSPFDLSQTIAAHAAFQKMIQAARETGELKRLLGVRTWIARNDTRLLGRSEIQLLPGGAGLSLTFERWWYTLGEKRVVEWSRISEHVDWNGAPLLVTLTKVTPQAGEVRNRVRSEMHRPASAAGEYASEVYEGDKRTRSMTATFGEPSTITSHLFAQLLLPVLAQHLGDEEWRIEWNSLIGDSTRTLVLDPGRRSPDGKHEQPGQFALVAVQSGRKHLAELFWPEIGDWLTATDAAALAKLALRPPTSAAIPWPPGAAPLNKARSARLSERWLAELQALGGSAPARRAKARTALVAAIERGAPTERLGALRALARLKPGKGSADLFRAGIVKNLTALGPVRVAALTAHHTILGPNLEALNAAWNTRDRELDLALTRLIVLHTGRRTFGLWDVRIRELLSSEGDGIRSATLRGLKGAEIGMYVAAKLVKLAKRRTLQPEVRAAVASLGKKPAECVTLLIEASSDPSRSVASDMVRGLSFGVPTSERPRVAEALIELHNTRDDPFLRFDVRKTLETYKNQAWLDRLTWGKKR